MKPTHLASTRLKSLFPILGLGLLIAAPLRADLNSDLAFTDFSNVDINALAEGQVLQARGGLIDFQRGITTQSLYVIDAEPRQVRYKLTHWNPASHPELKVWMHKELLAKALPAMDSPAAMSPATMPLTTDQPATVPSTTDQPATVPSTTDQPTTLPPTTDQPATVPPTTDQSATMPPTTDQPATVPPTTDQPAADPSATIPPATDPPATMPRALPKAADFAELRNLPDNSSVNYLLNATVNLDPEHPALQLSKEEAESITTLRGQTTDPKTLFVNFWSQVLAGRSDSFLSGKAKNDNYAIAGGDIQPLNEIKSLIHSDIKVYIQYQALLHQTPVAASLKAIPASIYYESFDVEGGACLGTGAVYQTVVGNAIQSADIEYYINNGIYSSIELEELWPITVNGRNETLVWRSDMVSTSSVAYLHGTERLASGMIMLQDVKQAIDAFRSEFK